jgi:hypothetical protein
MGGGGGAIQQLLQCNAVCMDSYGPCDEKKVQMYSQFLYHYIHFLSFPLLCHTCGWQKK